MTSPASLPVRLMALEHTVGRASGAADDAALRSAIVNVANYYLRMAEGKTPAEMEAIIWQHDSLDGADHGPSCAAFASLTLELAAQVVGEQSWVTGGTSYPWPLHKWADVRVDPNPASPASSRCCRTPRRTSRWHPLGDGYQPHAGRLGAVRQPRRGGHRSTPAACCTRSAATRCRTSRSTRTSTRLRWPAQGVAGFVNNGDVPPAAATAVPALALPGPPARAAGDR